MNLISLPRAVARFYIVALLICALPSPLRAEPPGSLDLAFNPNVLGGVGAIYATAVQPDRKTVIGGNFSSVGGALRGSIARLNADGTVDPSFVASVNGSVYTIVVQEDGKVAVGGSFTTVNGIANTNSIIRFNDNGTVDPSFLGSTNSIVYTAAEQADGKLIIGGSFGSVNGTVLSYLARLNPNGTADSAFYASDNLNSSVYSVAIQPDGKVVVGGAFTNVKKQFSYVARFNTDGRLDSSFAPGGNGPNTTVNCVLVQPDGKLVIGGAFTTFNTTGGFNRIARLNADGSLDGGFNVGGAGADNTVYSMALQSDGKLLVGGSFTSLNGMLASRIGRLNADGTLDSVFGPVGGGANNLVSSLALQKDGTVLLGGSFTGVNAVGRNHMARLTNNTATESLMAPDARHVFWQRSGTAPEVSQVTFELSTQAGWVTLGPGTRVGTTADWQRTDQALPARGTLRARGRVSSGYQNGGSGLVETVSDYTLTAPTVATGGSKTNPTDAVLTATVSANGGQTDVVFQYSTDPTLTTGMVTSEVQTLPKDTERRTVYQDLFGLTPHTTYYYRARASSSAGATLGEILSINTGNSLPVAPDGAVVATTGDQQTYELPFPTTDADGDAVSLVAVYGNEFLTIDETKGHSVTFTPARNHAETLLVPYTVTDGFGGYASGLLTVTVEDNDPPTIDGTFAPRVFSVPQGGWITLPDYFQHASIVDNVGVASFAQNPSTLVVVREGTTTVTLEAWDHAGNRGELSFEVKVVVAGTSQSAISGSEMPGAGSDPRVPAGTTWRHFGVPSLTAGGTRAGWMASGRTLAGRVFHGIFSGPLGAPALRLRTGEPATDEAGDAVAGSGFEHFRDPVLAGDDFAVQATVKQREGEQQKGLWIGQVDGTVKRIALEGTEAPGGGGEFAAFVSLAMPAPGVVFFTARLKAPERSDFGLWVWSAEGGTRRVMVTGDLMEVDGHLMTIRSFQALTEVPGSPGHGRYAGDTGALDVRLRFADPDRTTAIATVAPDGTVQIIQRSGQRDQFGQVALDFGVPSSAGAGQEPTALVSFEGTTLRGRVFREPAIFDFHTHTLIADFYFSPVEVEPAIFAGFRAPVCGFGAGGQRVSAFAARLNGATARDDQGVWFCNNRAPILLAREGSEPPGAPGTKWKAFTSLTVLEGRGAMFTATLASGTAKVKAGNDAGLWATDSTGVLKLIVREGGPVGDKTLRHFDVLGAVAGSPGQRRAWTVGDASARVIYRAFFTDGSSGVVSTAVR